jgi:hypothetical protein
MSRTAFRLTLGALPLIAYPVFAAFSLDAVSSSGRYLSLRVVAAYCFRVGLLAYPLVYLTCLVAAITRKKRDEEVAFRAAGWPLRYLAGLTFLFIGIGVLEILAR